MQQRKDIRERLKLARELKCRKLKQQKVFK